jgi:hypothetical protein
MSMVTASTTSWSPCPITSTRKLSSSTCAQKKAEPEGRLV